MATTACILHMLADNKEIAAEMCVLGPTVSYTAQLHRRDPYRTN